MAQLFHRPYQITTAPMRNMKAYYLIEYVITPPRSARNKKPMTTEHHATFYQLEHSRGSNSGPRPPSNTTSLPVGGMLQVPWFVRNREILKGLDIPAMAETDNKLASNLQITVMSHTNTTISSLVMFQPKLNIRHLH